MSVTSNQHHICSGLVHNHAGKKGTKGHSPFTLACTFLGTHIHSSRFQRLQARCATRAEDMTCTWMVFSTVICLGAMKFSGTILVTVCGTISLTCVSHARVSLPTTHHLPPFAGNQLSQFSTRFIFA